MDFPVHIDTVSMGLPIMYFKRSQVEFLIYDVFLSLKVVFILVNSSDPDEMQHYAAFHLGLHCLPKYPFRGFQYTKGLQWIFFKNLGNFCFGSEPWYSWLRHGCR